MIIFGTADPGPAQYLSEVIQSIETPYICFCSQISQKVFAKNNIKAFVYTPQRLEKEKVSQIIVGSRTETAFDSLLLKWGNQNKIKTIMVIEHWTNFKERIFSLDESNLPSEIWVNDLESKNKLTRLGIEQQRIFVVGNPILERLQKSSKSNKLKTDAILFVSEDMSDESFKLKQNYGFDEYQVLETILRYKPEQKMLYIKLHPAEKIDKYENFCEEFGVEIIQEASKESLGDYEIIIGMNSFLLIELAMMKNRVYTYRPNQKELFIGEQLNLTYNLREKELTSLLRDQVHFYSNNPSVSFIGSKKNILNRLI